MKIAIVVPGRFDAFDLGRTLLDRGHDVRIFTNYPGWAVERFGFPKKNVRSFWLHGILTRFVAQMRRRFGTPTFEALFHRAFGGWARGVLRLDTWDVVCSWSGVSEELLRGNLPGNPIIHLMRESSHIRTQSDLLIEEETRTKTPLDRPSPWIIEREEREYLLAGAIVILSQFAYQSFIDQGVRPEKLRLLPLGVSLEKFRPRPDIIEARIDRIRTGRPLRILFVGTVSFRKGLVDFAEVVDKCGNGSFQFRLVGALPPNAKTFTLRLHTKAELTDRVPQFELPRQYAWGDVFLFPTIEDGYAVVLAQAAASGLPIIVTPNCSGPDLIRENDTGWVVPIRSPDSIVERLRWCDSHRDELCAMVERVYHDYQPREWSDVATDYEAICLADLAQKSARLLP